MDIGVPEEAPGVQVEHIRDPVPRENPRKSPEEPFVPKREKELVPA